MSKKIIFIHPNFPGQFLHLARRLVASGNEVVGLGEAGNLKRQAGMVRGAKLVGYSLKERTSKTHHYARLFEGNSIRAQATLQLCLNLKKEGFRPDVIAGHTGWGDMLFLREVFPEARICGYFNEGEWVDYNLID